MPMTAIRTRLLAPCQANRGLGVADRQRGPRRSSNEFSSSHSPPFSWYPRAETKSVGVYTRSPERTTNRRQQELGGRAVALARDQANRAVCNAG
jgi:hypothetical protein